MYAHLCGIPLQRRSRNPVSDARPSRGASATRSSIELSGVRTHSYGSAMRPTDGLRDPLRVNDLSGILTQLRVSAPIRRDLQSIRNRLAHLSGSGASADLDCMDHADPESHLGYRNLAYLCDVDRFTTPFVRTQSMFDGRLVPVAISDAASANRQAICTALPRERVYDDGEAARIDRPPPYRDPTPPPPYPHTDEWPATWAARADGHDGALARYRGAQRGRMPWVASTRSRSSTSSTSSTSAPQDRVPMLPSNTLEALLVETFGNTAQSVHAFQRFYRPEFDHGLAGAPDIDVPFDGTNLTDVFERQFAAFSRASTAGTRARVVRDVVSLAASSAMLTGIALQIASDSNVTGVWHLAAYRHANQPYGDARASWAMTGVEISKGILTSILSYLTMPPHHVTDEYLKRYENTMGFLLASIGDLEPLMSTVLARARRPRTESQISLVASGFGRHLSTAFTVINYGLAPVRLTLFSIERALYASQIQCPEWLYPVMGLLRVASSVSDTVRALLSQLGTHGRQAHFKYRMQALRRQVDLLDRLVKGVSHCAVTATVVRDTVRHVARVCTLVDNDVLLQLARSRPMREIVIDLLDADGAGRITIRDGVPHAVHARDMCDLCEASHLATLAPQALAARGVQIGVIASADSPEDRYRLQMQYPENHWGFGPEGAVRPLTLMRIAYRLSLSFQAWGIRVATRLVARITRNA